MYATFPKSQKNTYKKISSQGSSSPPIPASILQFGHKNKTYVPKNKEQNKSNTVSR